MPGNTLNYGHLEQMLGKPFDPVYAFLQHVPYLIDQARSRGRADAHSYRDFHVAGAMYAINPATKTAWVDVAGNLRRKPKTKVCAEKKLTRRAEKEGVSHAVGFVVLGTTDRHEIREVSGLPTPTLHLCSDCRQNVSAHPVVQSSTLVVHCGMEDDKNQTFTIGQIGDLYGRAEYGRPDDSLFNYQTGFTDWSQRLATYALLANREQVPEVALGERLRLAQLAISKQVTLA